MTRRAHDTEPAGEAPRTSAVARRTRYIAAALAFVTLAGVLGAAVWVSPRLTSIDRERVRLARLVPYQTVNLIDHEADQPRHYYVDMTPIVEKIRSAEYGDPPVDDAGVPVIDYTLFGGTESGVYNPITTSQYALGLYEEYLAGRAESRDAFLAQADWLVSMQSGDGGFYYQFDLPSRSLKAPWLSAVAQGEGMSVLVRAYYETDDDRYLEAATAALAPLTRRLDDGGLMYVDATGVWLEEYPEDPPTHVLNGAIFTLFGLYDLVQATGDPDAAALFDESADTLARNLDRYEDDGWVRYQLTDGSWATSTYYGLHIEQLRALAALTGDRRFAERADDWAYPLMHERWWLAGRTVARLAERVSAALGSGR